MPTYVIQTVTGREDKAKFLIEAAVRDVRLFIPKRVVSRKYEGAWHEEERVLFPGYLFVETEEIERFIDQLPFSFFNTYYKVIGRDEERYLSVSKEETEWIHKLTLGDGLTVAMSRGVKEGKTVTFTEGPLVGLEPLVTKVDRHKRSVTLEIELFGRVQQITVGAEIISLAKMME